MRRRFAIAPMMDWTDRHYRYFARLLTKHAFLYTEMVTTGAIIHGDRDRFLRFDPTEHPVALQLGGSNPKDLAACAKIGQDWGYDEINLNVGCPSDRVQEGKIGACLMAEPQLVADGIQAMVESTDIPITVKTRLGLDDNDNYDDFYSFVETTSKAGCKLFILHARNAWLKGLSPKQNRTVPPLKYDWVYQIKKDFPHLHIELNGGITTAESALPHLEHIDSVMVGRRAYEDPCSLFQVDSLLYSDHVPIKLRSDVLIQFHQYVLSELSKDAKMSDPSKHLLGLFNGLKGARKWRQALASIHHNDDWSALIALAIEIESDHQ